MPEPDLRKDWLRALIDSAPEGPPGGRGGALKRVVWRLLGRAERARLVQRQQIDRELLAEISRLARTAGEADAQLTVGLDELREWLHDVAASFDELRVWLSNLQSQHKQVGEKLSALSEQMPTASPLYGAGAILFETFDAGLGGLVVGFRRGPATDEREGVYVGFEGYFRGSEETIRERHRAYLPLLERRGPVLDVGCGRGEMLELLGQSGVEARGVDIDSAMVEHCRRKGLDRVDASDAVSYLESLENGSLGAIVALQVIEHLPYAQLLSFLDAARRKLRPEGRLIVETINPHSPQALKHFWIDLTHQHPLFPEVVIALCALSGFADAFIWYPQGSGDPERDRGHEFDYAVVAHSPSAAAI